MSDSSSPLKSMSSTASKWRQRSGWTPHSCGIDQPPHVVAESRIFDVALCQNMIIKLLGPWWDMWTWTSCLLIPRKLAYPTPWRQRLRRPEGRRLPASRRFKKQAFKCIRLGWCTCKELGHAGLLGRTFLSANLYMLYNSSEWHSQRNRGKPNRQPQKTKRKPKEKTSEPKGNPKQNQRFSPRS